MSDPQTILVQELLQAKFDDADLKSYTKRWTKNGEQKQAGPFTYVEDEAVMDRLDVVLGFGGWQVTEATPVSDTCVRLTINAKDPATGAWTSYTDFGYATNADSAEPLKEAWTDAFRRTARLLGVARYVYAGEAPAPSVAPQPTSATLTATVPQSVEQAAPVERPPLPPQTVPYQDRNDPSGDACPQHGPWTVQPGGVTKSGPRQGQSYDPFWKCAGKGPNNSFCKERPSKAWVDAHPIAS